MSSSHWWTAVPPDTRRRLILHWQKAREYEHGQRAVRPRLRVPVPPGLCCTYCGHRATTWDHKTSRHNGGSEAPDNLTPACTSCNPRKNRDVTHAEMLAAPRCGLCNAPHPHMGAPPNVSLCCSGCPSRLRRGDVLPENRAALAAKARRYVTTTRPPTPPADVAPTAPAGGLVLARLRAAASGAERSSTPPRGLERLRRGAVLPAGRAALAAKVRRDVTTIRPPTPPADVVPTAPAGGVVLARLRAAAGSPSSTRPSGLERLRRLGPHR